MVKQRKGSNSATAPSKRTASSKAAGHHGLKKGKRKSSDHAAVGRGSGGRGAKGSGSSSSKEYYAMNTSEQQFILRVPEDLAAPLRAATTEDPSKSIDTKAIEDLTFEAMAWGDKDHIGTLVDLPCIIESMKTVDHKQYYKLADISQMMVVGEVPEDVRRRMEDEYTWPDGITNPLKNVRQRRFQKRASRKLIENVESEVQRLIEADKKAIHVEYVVQGMMDDSLSEMPTPLPGSAEQSIMGDHEGMDVDDEDLRLLQEMEASLGSDEESELGDLAAEIEHGLLSDEDEDEDMDGEDKEAKEEQSLQEHVETIEANEPSETFAPAPPKEDLVDANMVVDVEKETTMDADMAKAEVISMGDDVNVAEQAMNAQEITALEEQLSAQRKDVNDVTQRLAEKLNQLKNTTNPIIKKRFSSAITQLEQELAEAEGKVEASEAALLELRGS